VQERYRAIDLLALGQQAVSDNDTARVERT
jgi:hypothetical protein